ncbi:sialidase family protein [Microbacterium sp. NPDC058342]|uniref:sialidase family protein n=1 Tax=Microbacterium sp. NPDC058342 TaxID=3346454 RepID=UPI0036650018
MSVVSVRAEDVERVEVYAPEQRPGFVAWVTGFDYGDGRVGVSFKETVSAPDPRYVPPLLEMGEATGAPVSYASIECGSATEFSERVYLVSDDAGRTYRETGRCHLDDGSFCNVGFPDGRIIGLDVGRVNAERTGWCDFIDVRESSDGGSTWTGVTRLLEGTAPYLWRVRRLRDGSIIVLASLYGTPWGGDRERSTRNTMLPGETYLSKIQTFFLTSSDGRTYSAPHYVLPGIGAHEYDVVELADGGLLFIAGDVQGTPVGRQIVRRHGDGFINGPMLPIRRGAPSDPTADPQGGHVPESIVALPGDVLVGSRRGKPYSASNDLGENWLPVDGLPPSLYQPFLMTMPDGRVANYGHRGGDSAFGQEDMTIAVDLFRISDGLPAPRRLTLERLMSADHDQYLNAFSARLSSAEGPCAGVEVTFRFLPVWNADGTASTLPQDRAPVVRAAMTDADGVARVDASFFDGIGDIHFFYNVDAVAEPSDGGEVHSPMMCVAALTARRRTRFPHDAYFAGGVLYVSPQLQADAPDLIATLRAHAGTDDPYLPDGVLDAVIVERLLSAGVLRREGERLRWLASVHAPHPLDDVQDAGTGDWYA